MNLKNLHRLGLNSDSDFRAKATFGVALAALTLLFPIAILDLVLGEILTGIGATGIFLLLATNARLVYTGRCHQRLTLYVLVPAGMLFMTTVFAKDGFIGSLWCYPSIVACYCMLSERRAWLANACILTISLPMVATTLSFHYSIRVSATLICISLFAAILVRVIDKLHRQLQHQLEHDPLTGLLNRLTLKEVIEQAITDYKKQGVPATLLAIDADHFKAINDNHGHDAGDKTLSILSKIFSDNMRAEDSAFRTGGEEFLIVLHGSDEREANAIAERLRRLVEVATIVPGHPVTVSIGAATHVPGESWTDWVKRSDDHLYEAKRLGRNRVTMTIRHKLVSNTDATAAN